ncbi:MAG: hypothetical protein NZ583_08095 [Desulfobacterota bacterium]|nr:hypothetical protein [Thermodesulfobacteriota bacterium]MDW8002208.1 hypothetical protein [Deltaproteobacteria bacterium]
MTNREKILKEQGWEKRMIACEPKLSELVELYKEIGFEVHLEPLPDVEKFDSSSLDSDEECLLCYEQNRDKYRIIFTRRKE